jgi:hypothetical protein
VLLSKKLQEKKTNKNVDRFSFPLFSRKQNKKKIYEEKKNVYLWRA